MQVVRRERVPRARVTAASRQAVFVSVGRYSVFGAFVCLLHSTSNTCCSDAAPAGYPAITSCCDHLPSRHTQEKNRQLDK